MSLNTLYLYTNENQFRNVYRFIAGVDEAGRGPIAGPVVIAAVILNESKQIEGVNDSKKISAKKRNKLSQLIKQNALAFSIVEVSHLRIDEVNILQSVLEGMLQAVLELQVKPDLCLIDGNKLPKGIKVDAQACIKGDATFASIAAASILAKVHRDEIMTQQDKLYPEYGFAQHKGYPTSLHLKALRQYGPCPIHRLSYAPLRLLGIGSG
jgi:ribonuclease HII